MTISVPPILETRLRDEASRRGVDAEQCAAQLIEQGLGQAPANAATLRLLAEWNAQESVLGEEDSLPQRAEAEQFMRNLARNRVEMEGTNARKLWP